MSHLYDLARPLFFSLQAETAHGLAIRALKLGLVPRPRVTFDPVLESSHWGLRFPSPVGLAAGFDKNAEVPDAMLAQGFGFVEAGTVTPRPQDGNPRPRMFRLVEDRAVINRLGFNNQGMEAARQRLLARRAAGRGGILGINIGANKDSADMAADYETGIRGFYGLADYFTVNISSPNTPGLRAWQKAEALDRLLGRVISARTAAHDAAGGNGRPMPLLVKVAPDLEPAERAEMAEILLRHGVDGIIVSNTTISRPASLRSPQARETGGLSGAPLKPLATEVLRDFYGHTKGRVPLIGVGGIASGADAYARIRAGASLVQLYSAMVYEGPDLALRIARDLAGLIKADGFASISEAVGADHRP